MEAVSKALKEYAEILEKFTKKITEIVQKKEIDNLKKLGRNEKTINFIIKARKIHGFRYNYHNTEYINSRSNIMIFCKIHNYFSQNSHNHLKGSNCKSCVKKKCMNSEEFILKARKIHGDRYDYSKVNCINNKTNIIIICKKHNGFSQIPYVHLNGSGCKECGKMVNKIGNKIENKINCISTKSFIERSNKIHNHKYDYSQVKIVNSKTKVTIVCKIHKSFQQKLYSHLEGYGCKNCKNKTEGKLFNFLEPKYFVSQQPKFDWCKNIKTEKFLPFDFLIKENIIIELDGGQHFKDVKYFKSLAENQIKRDIFKMKCANENGYSVIRLLQDDVFHDKNNWESNLLSAINKIIEEKIIQNIYICSNDKYKNHKI